MITPQRWERRLKREAIGPALVAVMGLGCLALSIGAWGDDWVAVVAGIFGFVAAEVLAVAWEWARRGTIRFLKPYLSGELDYRRD